MIARLAARNMRHHIVHDVVYFMTLMTGIALVYAFYAVEDQFILKELMEDDKIVSGMKYVMPGIGTMLVIVLAFLIVYANHFLMNERKKEFGVYMLLGMEKKRLAGVLLAETAFVGVLSMIAGILFGFLLSQGLSVFTAGLFEADMSEFAFHISGGAVGKTMLHFLAIFVFLFVWDLAVVGKMRLVSLLNAGQRGEPDTVRNPVVCLLVFLAAAGLLAHIYHSVTVNLALIQTPQQAFYELGRLALATVLIFWSLSGLLLFLARVSRRFYLKGIRAFTVREISGRINTNVLTGSVISFLMFIAISVCMICFSVAFKMNGNLRSLAPADLLLACRYDPVVGAQLPETDELLREAGVDTRLLKDMAEFTVYRAPEWEDDGGEDGVNVFANAGDIVGISDYNKLAEVYGMEKQSLAEDEYFVVANYPSSIRSYNRQFLSQGHVITLNGKSYHPKYEECRDGILRMSYVVENIGYTVVPDQAVSGGKLEQDRRCLAANYNVDDEQEKEELDAYVKSDAFFHKLSEGKNPETENSSGEMEESWYAWGVYKSDLYRQSVGVTSMIVFLGLYIGIVFFIASAALFSLKELSQAADNRGKYETLARLGVDPKMIRRSLLFQNAIFFAGPLAVAALHSIFGMQAFRALILGVSDLFVVSEMRRAMLMAALILIGIYVVYFIITYRYGRNIIEKFKRE